MIRRVLVPALAFAFSALIVSTAAGQAKPAAPTTTAPAAPAKWVPPIKGTATIDVIRGTPKRAGSDVVNVLKIKNTSKGPIALLGIDEYWYNQKGDIISGDTQKVRRNLAPGEIVEVTMKSPWKEGMYSNAYRFSHANGKIDVKTVKKFE